MLGGIEFEKRKRNKIKKNKLNTKRGKETKGRRGNGIRWKQVFFNNKKNVMCL